MLEERDAARADSRLKARFLSYRLNQPSADESAVLLTTARAEMLILTLCCARSPVKASLDLMPGGQLGHRLLALECFQGHFGLECWAALPPFF